MGARILVYVGGVMVLFSVCHNAGQCKRKRKNNLPGYFTRQYISAVVSCFLLGGAFLFSMAAVGEMKTIFSFQRRQSMAQGMILKAAPRCSIAGRGPKTRRPWSKRCINPGGVAVLGCVGAVAGCDHLGKLLARGRKQKACSIDFLKLEAGIMHPLLTNLLLQAVMPRNAELPRPVGNDSEPFDLYYAVILLFIRGVAGFLTRPKYHHHLYRLSCLS